MENVTVQKAELIKVLEDNRSAHRAIFEEALEGYRAVVIQELEAHLEQVRQGKVVRVAINLPLPEDHTKDYDRAIRMVSMDVHDTIDLSEIDFQSYVMDDWRWKRQFLTSNSSYSGTAKIELGQEGF